MSDAKPPRPVVLCILDGWGELGTREANAIRLANAPNWVALERDHPSATLEASEHYVGLPDDQMGNSEVGHMNLGAGRVVLQDLPRIDKAIEDGSLARSRPLNEFISSMKRSGGTVHLMGLLSPGGVHSHQHHMAFLAGHLAKAGLKVAIHAFLDGRDTPPRSAQDFRTAFERETGAAGVRFATVSGRYFAMDRDNRWDRVSRAYAAIVEGRGKQAADAGAAIDAGYERGENDEFIQPTVIGGYAGAADGDGVLMANFRTDRAREILAALLDPGFDSFERAKQVAFSAALGMVEYSTELSQRMTTLFDPSMPSHTLGEIVSRAGLRQLRIAETEKYAHVTYFFNGGDERVFDGEERILVPSPKVATYDLQPEMSAPEVTAKLVAAIDSGRFDLIVVNFANADMVGHSGILDAAIKAIESVDGCLGKLEHAVARAGGALLITADHGNAEQMVDPGTGKPQTAHTTNPVPIVLFNGPPWAKGLKSGILADVAPTLLALLGLEQPREMTGHSLIDRSDARSAPQRAIA